jgi:hypothetical protein
VYMVQVGVSVMCGDDLILDSNFVWHPSRLGGIGESLGGI